jgi:hypothetical protein
MLIKVLAVTMMLSIMASLAMGLVYLVRDRGQSERTVRALTLRVALSVTLFSIFLALAALGLISPHGVHPG